MEHLAGMTLDELADELDFAIVMLKPGADSDKPGWRKRLAALVNELERRFGSIPSQATERATLDELAAARVQSGYCRFCGLSPCVCATPAEIAASPIRVGGDDD